MNVFPGRPASFAESIHLALAGFSGRGFAPGAFAVGTMLFAWLILWNKLRADWSTNDQYEYGWFVPPLAFALLGLRWTDRPPLSSDRLISRWGLAVLCAGSLLLLLPVRLIEEPNPDWRMLFWVHAVLLTCLSFGGLFWTGGFSWLRHFAFPISFLLLAIPWPSDLEQAVVQSLMRTVAEIAADGMNLLGIPAVASGNIIHIRDQTVGVSEACSGIRSLQTTLMAGLLLGELSRLRWPRRLALLGYGLALAMAANVFRSSLLVWIAAKHGAASLEQFHDFAGFSVLLIVFAGLLGIERLLARASHGMRSGAADTRAPRPAPVSCPALSGWIVLGAAIWLVAVEAGTAAWYGLYAPPSGHVPRWTVAAPAAAPGLKPLVIDPHTTQLLRYDEAVSAKWTRPGPPQTDCTLFFFRWEAGHSSGAQAEMHQPHICLTATGLTQIADSGVQPVTAPAGIILPVRRYEFTQYGRSIFVFFIAWQDRSGAQTLRNDAGSRWDRLRAVLEHQANTGRQTLELVAVGPKDARQANAWFEQEIGALVHPLDVDKAAAER